MDNKGFTITELIVTFVIVMSITLGLFSVVDNYRERQQKASYRKELNAYKNEIVKTIQDDILYKGLHKIEGIEKEDGYNQSIRIEFKDKDEYGNNYKKDLSVGNSGIKYGNMLYPIPNRFVKFTDDIIYLASGQIGGPTGNYDVTVYPSTDSEKNLKKRIYSINIDMTHTELKGEVFDINIVAVANDAVVNEETANESNP